MAGYIFSVSKEYWDRVLNDNIKKGYFTPFTPTIELDVINEDRFQKRKSINKILLSTFADFITMRPGDNVYFLSNRKIYGIGSMVRIGEDCKYDNYISASCLYPNCMQDDDMQFLTTSNSSARWVCFFKPDLHFFLKGIDMDDVLKYKPNSFKMLRAFEGLTFIKVDDEENRALKEYLYIVNQVRKDLTEKDIIEFDEGLHNELRKRDLSPFLMNINNALKDKNNSEYLKCEMLLEAAILQNLNENNLEELGEWDYLSHQLIASPFKPLQYIDKIDVFGYKFLSEYPDYPKLIAKYLVIELKKDKINSTALGQTMQYVDWICKEYASGDYSRVSAYVIGSDVTRGISNALEEYCIRDYIVESHPVKTKRWNDVKLIKYEIDDEIKFEIIDI